MLSYIIIGDLYNLGLIQFIFLLFIASPIVLLALNNKDKSGLLTLSIGVGTVTINISAFCKSFGSEVNMRFFVSNRSLFFISCVLSIPSFNSFILLNLYQNQ